MPTLLIYVLLATTGAPSAVVLTQTTEPTRCEAIKVQIEQAPSTGRAYRCETLVAPRGVI